MDDRFASTRGISYLVPNCRIIINNALDSLRKRRSQDELRRFLRIVEKQLAPFNIPGHAQSIVDRAEPPKGPAWSVAVAMTNEDKGFFAFAKKHGQVDVFLAAIALSDPETHDPYFIQALDLCTSNIEKALLAKTNSEKAKKSRSPIRQLILYLLCQYPGESAQEIWEKIKASHGTEVSLNKIANDIHIREVEFDEMSEFAEKIEYTWGKKRGELSRKSLDKEITNLRRKYGIEQDSSFNASIIRAKIDEEHGEQKEECSPTASVNALIKSLSGSR